MMRSSFLCAAALALSTAASLAQTWTQIPLPPGVTQFVETALTFGGEYPLALTNSGAELWEYRGGAWQSLPLPAGLPTIGGGTGSRILPGGTRPLLMTDFGTVLREWDGLQWVTIPLPPGASEIGGTSGVEMLNCGARPLATTGFGTSLWEWDGASWNTLPLPPGEAAIGSAFAARSEPGSSTRHLVSTGFGTGLVEWDGSQWVTVPLPAGTTSVAGGSSTQLQPRRDVLPWSGRAGANVTVTTDFGANLRQWIQGQWLDIPLPAGIDLTTAGNNRIARGCRSALLLSAFSGTQLWALDTQFRRNWTQLPLPPGVTQFVETVLTFGARYPLALTNSGAELWEYRGGAWQSLPLPAGLPTIGGGTGSRILPGGTRPLLMTDFSTVLREWDGLQWVTIPLPPGASEIGGTSGVEMLNCGARPLATTGFGTSLWEWNGVSWNALPLPPGEAAIGSAFAARSEPGSSTRHLVSTGFGTGLLEWDGTQWVSVPLPAGTTSVAGGSSTQLQPRRDVLPWSGRAGANVTVTTNFGGNLRQWIQGQWEPVPMPAGIDLTTAGNNRIARGCRSALLLSAFSGTQLWALFDPTVEVEAPSQCAGSSTLTVTGDARLGETITLTMAAPLASWFTGLSLTPPVALPMCSCPGLVTAVWAYGAQPLTIPNAPQLLGAELYAQGMDFLPGAMSCTLPPPAALTDVLRLVIG